MDVIVDGQRYPAIPDLLGPWVEAYARARGRETAWMTPQTLEVRGPLHGRRVVLHCSEPDPLLKAVAIESQAQLQRLGAAVRVTGAETGELLRHFDPDVLIGLRLGRRAPAEVRGLRAQPVERFRRSDLYLARALLERVALQTGLPSRGVPLWAWRGSEQVLPAVSEACATVVLECGCPENPADAQVLEQPGFARQCAVGLAEAMLRFAGLPVEQLNTIAREQEEPAEPVQLVSGRPRQDGPATMVEAPDGHWVSPRAQALLEQERRHAPDTPGVD